MHLKERVKEILLMTIALAVMTVAGVMVLSKENHTDLDQIRKGRAYLYALEKQNVGSIEKKIKEQNQKKETKEVDQELLAVYKDQNKVWPLFKDYVILGDSRAADFNQFLSQTNVLAEKNKTISDIDTKLTKVQSLSPSRIIVCYGLNDVSVTRWHNINLYIQDFEGALKRLHKVCPDATIYICSILPTLKFPDPSYHKIGSYNYALSRMCQKDGYVYIDNTDIANAHRDLYEPDGQHLTGAFYKYWGFNIMKAIHAHEKRKV